MIGNHPTIEGGLALTITTLCDKFKDDLINEAKESKADLPNERNTCKKRATK